MSSDPRPKNGKDDIYRDQLRQRSRRSKRSEEADYEAVDQDDRSAVDRRSRIRTKLPSVRFKIRLDSFAVVQEYGFPRAHHVVVKPGIAG
jgi:hypothetical protein